jgi:hypothetical protein
MTAMRDARGCIENPSGTHYIRVLALKLGHRFPRMNTDLKNVTTEATEVHRGKINDRIPLVSDNPRQEFS